MTFLEFVMLHRQAIQALDLKPDLDTYNYMLRYGMCMCPITVVTKYKVPVYKHLDARPKNLDYKIHGFNLGMSNDLVAMIAWCADTASDVFVNAKGETYCADTARACLDGTL